MSSTCNVGEGGTIKFVPSLSFSPKYPSLSAKELILMAFYKE